MTFDLVKASIAQSGLQEGTKSLCFGIIDVVEGLPEGDGQFLPISFFQNHLDGWEPHRIVHALNVLSSLGSPVLKPHAYIVDGDTQTVLDDDDFKSFLEGGLLVHPELGEPIDNPAERIHLFYSIRRDVKSSMHG